VRSDLNLDKVGITLAARYNCSFKCVQVSHGSSGMEENLWLLWRNEVLTGYSHFETKSNVIERIGTHLLAILSPALKLLNRTVLWLLTARYPAEDGWPLPRKSLLLYYNEYITRIYIYIYVYIYRYIYIPSRRWSLPVVSTTTEEIVNRNPLNPQIPRF
jgi:hypothetical protein